jgi:hypothetical protein
MRRLIILATLVVAAVAVAVPAYVVNNSPGQKISSSTTLDACGYFVGTQTANQTTSSVSSGVTSYTEKGTWTGVTNDYSFTPVASLGSVMGSYIEATTTNADGSITTGTETFHSNAGEIDQTFSYSAADVWDVTVTATGSLSFLTSSTNGACHAGPFPRR